MTIFKKLPFHYNDGVNNNAIKFERVIFQHIFEVNFG